MDIHRSGLSLLDLQVVCSAVFLAAIMPLSNWRPVMTSVHFLHKSERKALLSALSCPGCQVVCSAVFLAAAVMPLANWQPVVTSVQAQSAKVFAEQINPVKGPEEKPASMLAGLVSAVNSPGLLGCDRHT